MTRRVSEGEELDLTIDGRADERHVDDGDIITSAGVSAGTDMALHLRQALGRRGTSTQGAVGHPVRPGTPDVSEAVCVARKPLDWRVRCVLILGSSRTIWVR